MVGVQTKVRHQNVIVPCTKYRGGTCMSHNMQSHCFEDQFTKVMAWDEQVLISHV